MYNSQGVLVLKKNVIEGKNVELIVQSLPQGVYSVVVNFDSKQEVQSIVKL
jgi:hypothetical protein